MSVVYDAGVLIAADRDDRDVWLDHRSRLEAQIAVVTTAPVVAQVSRSGRRVLLRRFLRGCVIAQFTEDEAHGVGALLAAAGSNDVVDAHVAFVAGSLGAEILTSDEDDLHALVAHLPSPVGVRRV